jgi:predicted nucleic acid-binding protein
MTLVDSSVWIDYFNGRTTPETDILDWLLSERPILVGDLIVGEVLQGFRRDAEFEQALDALSKLTLVPLVGPTLALQSARNYRELCKKGITVRKTIDCFIATFCIENGHDLLHSDSDFGPFESHLGLRVLRSRD